MTERLKIWPQVTAALLAFAASAYSILWAISAISLAFTACDGTYSIDAASFRCQRPVILEYAFLLFALVGIGFSVWAWVRSRRSHIAD